MEVGGNRWLFMYAVLYIRLLTTDDVRYRQDRQTPKKSEKTNFLAPCYIGLFSEINL